MSLPSYDEAMKGFSTKGLTDAESIKKRFPSWNWSLGAQLLCSYLDGNQLAAFCLLSKECCTAFRPMLWLDPFRIFKEKKRPAYKHYQFMFLAHNVSLEVRSLVQTLDFEQINYFGLNTRIRTLPQLSPERQIRDIAYTTAWFVYCTKLFPRLLFAMMDDLPPIIYDQTAALRLQQADPLNLFGAYTAPPAASAEPTKINPLLFSFHGIGRLSIFTEIFTSSILYLDLSYSKMGPDNPRSFYDVDFGNIRVLKLRGCRIEDSELEKWLRAASRVWLLDLRDNFLTDRTADHLLNFSVRSLLPAPRDLPDGPSDRHLYADAPEYIRQDGQRMASTVTRRPSEKHHFASHIKKRAIFLSSIHDQILDENDPVLRNTGLTQLFIAGNRLSSRGVKHLLNLTNRLQHLDVGSVKATESNKFNGPYTTVYAQVDLKTTQGLLYQSGTCMEVLRVHHSIVTSTPTFIDARSRINSFSLPLVKSAEKFAENLTSDRLAMQPPQRAFSPLTNYRITDLTLTGLPSKSYGFTIIQLIAFLDDCAVQEAVLNEARSSASPNRRAPQLHPGLRTLRLEFLPEDTTQYASALSVSGDADADTFLASSLGDFSFFGQDTMSSVSRRGSVATTGSETGRGNRTPLSRTGLLMGSAGLAMLDRSITAVGVEQQSPVTETPPVYDGVLDVKKALSDWRVKNSHRWTGAIKIIQMKN